MCRNDTQSKKLIRLKYLIIETPYTFFSIFSWYFIVLDFLSPMLSGINNNKFSFFGFFNLSFFAFVLTTLKKENNTVPGQSTLISQEVFCGYQISSGNTTNLNSNL